jgi:uncharacterized membrane protein YdbT with pleckstrin-like domain
MVCSIMVEMRQQAITGLVPPQVAEARIREVWPSVARAPAVATLGRVLTRTIVLAPLGWLLMSLWYFAKVAPFWACRYTLTNRRLMIRRGWSGKVVQEVPLKDIEEVRLVPDANSQFFRAATLEIISQNQVVLRLPGTPEPDSFRLAILNACNAWVPERTKKIPFLPASAVKAG